MRLKRIEAALRLVEYLEYMMLVLSLCDSSVYVRINKMQVLPLLLIQIVVAVLLINHFGYIFNSYSHMDRVCCEALLLVVLSFSQFKQRFITGIKPVCVLLAIYMILYLIDERLCERKLTYM